MLGQGQDWDSRLKIHVRATHGIGGDMRDRRDKRRAYFEFFSENSIRWFNEIAAADRRHAGLTNIYNFGVSPNGRDGGISERDVEVFYGQRPFERVKELVHQEHGLPALRTRFLVERGASLHYQRGDDGAVIVTLAPAITESFRPPESSIVLDFLREPSPLKALPWLDVPPRIERHWRCLMSYIQCTSIDGDPTWGDRLRVAWLRWTRNLIVDEKLMPPRWRTQITWVLSWVLTVGLSGTVLYFIQRAFPAPPPL